MGSESLVVMAVIGYAWARHSQQSQNQAQSQDEQSELL